VAPIPRRGRLVSRPWETIVAAPTDAPRQSPLTEYTRRREERLQLADQLTWRERLLGNARVAVFLAALLAGWFAFGMHLFSPWWLLAPLAIFIVLLFRHEQVVRDGHRARRAVAFYEQGITRIEDRWQGRGESGLRFLSETHPYAADLDLFGKGSLFELLCTARTRTGEDTLASWLLAGANPQEVRARQQAVQELSPQLDLREDLALLGGDVPTGIDFANIVAWGESPPLLPAGWLRWPILALGMLSIACLAGWQLAVFGMLDPTSLAGAFFAQAGSIPFGLVVCIQLVIAALLVRRVHAVLSHLEKRGRDLATLARVLARLERATFQCERLRQLHAELGEKDGVPPSQRIARLSNLIDLLESRRNQVFMPFAILLMWGTVMAFAIEDWRRTAGPAVRAWLDTVGQLEALCALAAYAYENPDDVFPTLVEEGPLYEGVALGHPLLPRARCVRNDLHISGELRVLVVSGSNMSGKSTFLRTVGINAVLALAGAPVRARSMRLSSLTLGATLRIQDSLQAGRSRFYAEILRVRQVVDLSRGPVPLLFLLDEIFAGTNSHDRHLGAEAVVSGLVDAGAAGLVTTHDLSLTRIAEELGAKAVNVHFADHFENGEMTFDYRLQPGVVRNSNALALMRAVGLQV
jgi:MutS domain V